MNLKSLIESLKQLDEITLLEVLDLHADEIVDKFRHEISERFEELRYKVEEPHIQVREEERFEPLTGKLSWETPHEETYDFDDYNERS